MSIIRTLLGAGIIIIAMIFIYPIELYMLMGMVIGMDILMWDEEDDDLIKGFGKAKIESYEKVEDIGKDIGRKQYKIVYFNEEQADKFEKQMEEDDNWSSKPFSQNIIEEYVNVNIDQIKDPMYYIIQLDRESREIESDSDIINNQLGFWFNSAIYDSTNNVLYYYCHHYER